MSTGGLVSYLVRQFRVRSTENLATAALHFVLDGSTACREALRNIVNACGANVEDDLTYRLQAWGEDGAVPDLVGGRPGEPPMVIVEGKFWAGLTDNQPGTYLGRLASGSPGILLFVAPAQRFDTLWPEVVARCTDALAVAGSEVRQDGLRAVKLTTGHVLAMASWRLLLDRMKVAAQATGDSGLMSDLGQLTTLCEAQDRMAFLPLHGDDLTDLRVPRRHLDYNALAVDALRRAVAAGCASTYRLSTGGGSGRTGWYLWIGQWMGFITFDPQLWLEFGYGPLWLEFRDGIWVAGTPTPVNRPVAHEIRPMLEHLPRLRGGRPPFLVKTDGRIAVPLLLRTHAEKGGHARQPSDQPNR